MFINKKNKKKHDTWFYDVEELSLMPIINILLSIRGPEDVYSERCYQMADRP